MKYRLGLIGLGTITEEYLIGLNDNSNFDLVSMCDINENAKGRKFFKSNFYIDYKKMIKKEKLDYVLVCTPPSSHYEIAKYCLKHNINVIVEKPATLNLKHFDKLIDVSKKYNSKLHFMFHWRYGEEVLQFKKMYDTNKIQSIDVLINDAYCTNNVINPDRVCLNGCWVDSGVNALSFIDSLLNIKSYKIISNKVTLDVINNLPIHSITELLINNIKVKIEIDWTKNINNKISYIKLNNKLIMIDHSNQTIKDKDNKQFNDIPRLQRHYYNYFNHFNDENMINDIQARIIHEILFLVGDKQ